MKKIFLLMLFVLLLCQAVFAAQKQDVVYLKNGSIIRGEITEQIPNVSIKIETKDGSVFVYKMSEVEKMTKKASKSEEGTETKAAGTRTLAGNPERQFALLINPLGFLQFGPQLDFEIKLAQNNYLLLLARWHAGGLLSYVIDDSIRLDHIAFGAGYRYFLRPPENPDALVLGFQCQYGFGTSASDVGHTYETNGRGAYIAGALETAYRWRFDKFLVTTGLIYGLATDLVTEYWYISAPSVIIHNPKKVYFFGMFELQLGTEF
jgi:hypothetical protein